MAHFGLNRNLRRLLLVRSIILSGGLVASLFAFFVLDARLQPLPILAVFVVALVVAALTYRRLKSPREVTERELFAQMLFDVIALTVILDFAGGSANPFTCLYLIPVTLTAATLPRKRPTWGMVGATAVGYTYLLLTTEPAEHIHSASLQQTMSWHALGMWLGFMFSACLIAAFAVSMQTQLRKRDQELTEQREKAMRDQQLIELGALAAGAAHELGTPLATVAVLAGETHGDYPDDHALQARMALIKEQVQRCKKSLAVLSADAGQLRADGGRGLPLAEYLRRVIDEWRATRLDQVSVDYSVVTAPPGPMIITDLTLTHAITNILNNAADVSPQAVEISASWDNEELSLRIDDRGPGIGDDVLESLGRTRLERTASSNGLGIGLLLSSSTAARFGGSLEVAPRAGGGTSVSLRIPLNRILIETDRNLVVGDSAVNQEHEQAAARFKPAFTS